MIEQERRERRKRREDKERQAEEERAAQKARLEKLTAELELQRLREEENKKRQEDAKRRHDEKRIKEMEEEQKRLEAARAELDKLRKSLDFERSQMFEQRKADSIRRLKGKQLENSASKASRSPTGSAEPTRSSRISPYSSNVLLKLESKDDSDSEYDQGRETVAMIDYDASAYEENHDEIYFEDDKGNLVKSAISAPRKADLLQSALKKSTVPEGMDQKRLWDMYNDYCRRVTDNGKKPIKQKDADQSFQRFIAEAFNKKQ